jgi:hypothetical protein
MHYFHLQERRVECLRKIYGEEYNILGLENQ